jgi:hypothetical protein
MVKVLELVGCALAIMWLLGFGPLHGRSDVIHVMVALGAAAVLYRFVMGRHSTA